jgi:hypothetical protein
MLVVVVVDLNFLPAREGNSPKRDLVYPRRPRRDKSEELEITRKAPLSYCND